MESLIHQRVKLSQEGKNPSAICKVSSGWVVLGDTQMRHGYCILLSDPVVFSINDLPQKGREAFLFEMTVIGDAIIAATNCYRINYEIECNREQALHAHIIPRYADELDEIRARPVWLSPGWKNAPQFRLETHAKLMDEIKAYIRKVIPE